MKKVLAVIGIIFLFGSMKKPEVLICGQQMESRYFKNGKLIKVIRHGAKGFWLSNLNSLDFAGTKRFAADSFVVRIISPLQSNYRQP